ncbi:MAG: thiamine-phosphate kinase, partial [Thermoleophilaceae bacterium]|nr:thiamine-phosphate kinase [Thermoleophilaceae bacterium]
MGELELVAAIEARLRSRGGRVLRGPGDDAAVVLTGAAQAVSIDTVVQDTHFRLSTHSHADVGHLALASA